ncbi:MAG: hypothetical protein OEW42_09500 [Acidimicrobiia bacterium]|nr:hypothetical protein [Acidimicrobiia bacterium]
MSDPSVRERRLLALVAVSVVIGAVVWALAALGDDDPAPPTGQLSCLDVRHRPTPRTVDQHVLRLGVAVDGPDDRYRLRVQRGEDEVSTEAQVSRPALIEWPAAASVVEVTAITVTPVDQSGATVTDITEQVLGSAPWSVALPEAEGSIADGVPACADDAAGTVHAGFVFAPPVPVFAADGPPVDSAVTESVRTFLAEFARAQQGPETDALFASLHPVAVDGFGEEVCRAHLRATVGQVPALDVVGVQAVVGYRYQRPGGSDPLDEVYVVEATVPLAGSPTWRFNLAALDGELRWLSWCGN